MLPDFIIIGAQKAGSTFLVEALRAHPDVYCARSEIACFEDPEYDCGGPARLEQMLERGRGAKVIGYKRATMLGRPECPARIAQHAPEARLIAILRNPVERAVSSLYNMMHGSKMPVLPVDDAMRRLLDGSLQRDYPVTQDVLDWGFYHQHLTRYLQHFDRSRLLVLLHDDLKTDALGVVQAMYRFLGADESFRPLTLHRRPMATPTSPARLKVTRLLQRMYMRTSEDGTRRYLRRGPQSPALRKLSIAVDRLVLGPLLERGRPPLGDDLRRQAEALYRDDVRNLERLLDRDLSGWFVASGQ